MHSRLLEGKIVRHLILHCYVYSKSFQTECRDGYSEDDLACQECYFEEIVIQKEDVPFKVNCETGTVSYDLSTIRCYNTVEPISVALSLNDGEKVVCFRVIKIFLTPSLNIADGD